ncbi:MAG: 16S rRNA (uracil(1498)-N(3))-methyltransferase [Planctomycetes bacterium]|nr:16S rRNA (uracil(1498)-N(3))-methyltransferase [Planctomycetota bacterium]
MPRFYISHEIQDQEAILVDPERHHLIDVYRASINMEVELFDVRGNQYLAKLISYNNKEARLKILQKIVKQQKNNIEIYLAQSLIKSKNWDFILTKCVELGVDGIYPMITQHIAGGKYVAGKEERWEKLLITAAKQSGHTSFPKIFSIMNFLETLQATSDFPLRLMAHNDPQVPFLHSFLKQQTTIPTKVLLMIGPEGGFSEIEVQQAQENGVNSFLLGSYTMRAETAAIAGLANLNFYWER